MSEKNKKIWSVILKTITYLATAIAGAFGFETLSNF